MMVEWIKGVIAEQKRQKNDIKDLYNKYELMNTRISNTREEVLKADHCIDTEVTKIKTEINKDVSDITERRGQIYTAVAGIISIIIGVLFKIFGGA